jgi:DNA-binding IclR family transcriptional regulator
MSSPSPLPWTPDLDLIEYLSVRKSAGINELCGLLPMSKASVSRLLKTLADACYVRKDSSTASGPPSRRWP